MTIAFPVFVREKDSGDIERFDSLEEMQRRLERIDVENQEYEAWDRSGAPLRLAVQTPAWLAMNPLNDGSASDLTALLLDRARELGIETRGQTAADIADLFDRVRAAVKKQKRRRGR